MDPGPTLRTTALEVHSSPLKGLTAIFTLRHTYQPEMFCELYRKGGESIVPQHCFTLSTCKTIFKNQVTNLPKEGFHNCFNLPPFIPSYEATGQKREQRWWRLSASLPQRLEDWDLSHGSC